MEKLFNSDTKVIYIREKTNQYKIGNYKFLLWPYYAYKVLVPMPKENKFNLFQKYILKMCEAGVSKANEIDEKLKIGKELTAYILIQLKDNGMLDDEHNLTHTAKQLLNNEEELPTEQVAGYIFQSVNTGKLENIFLLEEDLNYVEVEKIGLYSRFKYGTTGNPLTGKGLTIFPELKSIEVPENIDILKSIIKYKRRKKIKSLSEKKNFDETSIPSLVNEVSVVSGKIPIWFATKLFIPKDIRKSTNWIIADPFSFDLNQTIREEIIAIVKKDTNKNLKEEIEKLTNETFSTENIDFIEIMEEKFAEASEELVSVFGNNIKNNKDLFEKLVDFYNSYQSFLIANDNRGNKYEEALKRVEEYLRVGYLLLEEIFYVLNNKYKNFYPKNILTKSSKSNNELIKKIFVDKIGFNENKNLNTYFLYQKYNLKSVMEFDNKDFRKLLAVTILTANEYLKHPLYSLSEKMPHFSNFLFEYKNLRDAASHSEKVDYPFERIKGIQNYIYSVLAILLEDYSLKLPFKKEVIKKVESKEIILRRKAELEIEKEFGENLTDDLKVVKDILISIKEKFIVLQSSNVDSELKYLNKTITDIIFNSSKIFEELLKLIFKKCKSKPDLIMLDKLDNLKKLAGSRGFETNKISDSFSYIDINKIKNKIEYVDKGVLKEKLIALLLCQNKIIDKIALKNPNFIEFLSNLTEIRSHGDKIYERINLSDTLDLTGEVFGKVKLLVNVIKSVEK